MYFSIKTVLLFLTLNVLLTSQNIRADETRLVLHWLPQAQFAGYYVAFEKGFYRQAGQNVTIIPGGPDIVPADLLSSGVADFATMFLAAAMERRIAGIPLVNVAQISQHSALMIITRKKDKIGSITDLDGKKITMWGNDFQLQPWALFKYYHINATTVPFGGSMELFLRGAVPATLAMWYNEYHTILSAGYRENELQPFFFKNTIFDFPEDGIYCLLTTAQKQPERVQAIVSATQKGWAYAFEHEEEALDIVEKYMLEAKIPVSRTHQRWMLKTMKKLMTPENSQDPFGTLNKKDYITVTKAIKDSGFTDHIISFDDFVWRGSNAK